MKCSKISFLFCSIFFTIMSCGGGDDDDLTDNNINTVEELIPGKVTLVSPQNEETCEPGEVVAEGYSDVTFSWNAAQNTELYEVKITNLNSNEVKRKTVNNTTTTKVLLHQAEQYSWSVISGNDTTAKETNSDIWKFYLSAPGEVSFAPFPADLIAPDNETVVSRNTGGVIRFSWYGSDPDQESSLTYTLYIDQIDGKQDPPESQSNLSENFFTLSLEANQTYHWRVKTSDGTHSSFSQVYSFQTNNDIVEPDESNFRSLRSETFFITQEIEGVSESRSVIIQTPEEIDANMDYPIVFAFHGRGGTNTSWINRLKNFTDSGEFIGIYPQGHLNSWNLGTEPSKADDIAFVDLIFTKLRNYRNLDFDKIYAIGTSNGSGMVNKLAIETNHFNAIAPIVSQLMESSPLTENTQPISVFQINGGADATIPIDGGPKLGHVFLDALESAQLWSNHFNCNPEPQIELIGEDTLYIFTNCNKEKEIRYLRVENGAHNLHWEDPQIMVKVWEFFKRF